MQEYSSDPVLGGAFEPDDEELFLVRSGGSPSSYSEYYNL